jgi:hypothetical protein
MQKQPARIIGCAFDRSDGELGGRGQKRHRKPLRRLLLKRCEPLIRGLQGHSVRFASWLTTWSKLVRLNLPCRFSASLTFLQAIRLSLFEMDV